MRILKRSSYILHVFAISLLYAEKSCSAEKITEDERITRIYTREAAKFLRSIDQSVNPCTDFYNFVCGGYMKRTRDSDAISPGYDRYTKLKDEIQDILKSERDVPGSDISVARNIYTNCMKIIPDELTKRNFIDTIATDLELITGKYRTPYLEVRYKWNKEFNWIDSVLKLRDMGLNFRFLVGLYVSPRSHNDKRNILEVRKPILESEDNKIRLLKEENLAIVNAGEFINSLNGSFPLQQLIEGLLPEDTNFSFEDEIRVDETYIRTLADALKNNSFNNLAKKLFKKIESEIERLLPDTFYYRRREIACLENAIYYDFNFQVAVSKMFFTKKKKDFVIEIMSSIIKTTKTMINHSASFDEECRNKSIKKLSDLQLMIAYGNNTIKPPELDWNDVDYRKYIDNMLTLSKHQMDAKYRQLNLENDVREWEIYMTPTTYNAAYYLNSNSLYMPALYLNTVVRNLALPSYIHYGSIGLKMAHELGHVIDKSTKYDRFWETSEKYNFTRSNVRKNKQCLRQAFHKLTEDYKDGERDDFADLTGYKIAYYTFLSEERRNDLLPGLNYNSQQMFWITSASSWCSKNPFEQPRDNIHSPNYARVLMPLSNLREFALDFNCPIGSPMNPQIKCQFL